MASVTQQLDVVRGRWASLPGNVRGGIFILISTFFFSIMLALIKLAGERLHVTQILFFRQVVMLLLALPVIVQDAPGAIRSARPGLQFTRVGCAFCAMLLGFTAFINLPLADATTLSFAKTFFMTVLAIIFLGEVVGIRRWAAVAVGFLGVMIVAWPTG
ncbi:MAG: EamA family transporter, partial [Pseudomonadota bacterium]